MIRASIVIALCFGAAAAYAQEEAAPAPAALKISAGPRNPLAESILMWDRITTDTIVQRVKLDKKASAAYELPYDDPKTGAKGTVLVEQRRFAVNYASPIAVARAFEIASTPGLGRFYYDPETAEFVVEDLAAALDRMKLFLEAMDTPTPAWLFGFPPQRTQEALERLKAALSSQTEMFPFLKEGAIIARGPADQLLKAQEIVKTAQLDLSPGPAALSAGWNQVPESARKAREERGPAAPMRYVTSGPRANETVEVEQRRLPIEHAAPAELLKALRPFLTPGLGRAHYEAATAELVVVDQPAVLDRLRAYVQAMDTTKPARLLRVAGGLTEAARAAIRENLSPEGEMLPFEDGTIVVVRDDEIHLSRVEVALRFARRPATPQPAAAKTSAPTP